MYPRPFSYWLGVAIKIIAIVLVIALFVMGIVSVVNIFGKKPAYKEIDLKYDVGGIISDETGEGVVDDSTNVISSVDAVPCTGFIINADFHTRTDYEIHYYTDDMQYVGYVSTHELQYAVDPGDMPILREVSGNLNDDAYKNSAAVKQDDKAGNEQDIPATRIRIVIRPMGETDFTGLTGWFNIQRFSNALVLKTTQAVASAK